jgi:hypothetical protein
LWPGSRLGPKRSAWIDSTICPELGFSFELAKLTHRISRSIAVHEPAMDLANPDSVLVRATLPSGQSSVEARAKP